MISNDADDDNDECDDVDDWCAQFCRLAMLIVQAYYYVLVKRQLSLHPSADSAASNLPMHIDDIVATVVLECGVNVCLRQYH